MFLEFKNNKNPEKVRNYITQVVMMLMLCAGLMLNVRTLQAQPVEPVSPAVTTPAVTPAVKPVIKSDIIYLPNKQGELVPIPYNADLDKYLEYVEKSAEKTSTVTNKYSINTLKMDGVVTREANGDEYVEIKTVVEFNLLQDEWVELPLKFLEASVIDKPVHKGAGEVIFKGRDKQQGQFWYAKGEGFHTLTMTQVVPIRKQFATRRVQLQVPEALASEFKIEIPNPKITIKKNDDSKVLRNQSINNKTLATITGFTERLDFSWTVESATAQAQKNLESDFSLTLQEDAQGFLINVQQQIVNLGGDVKQLVVVLPQEWEFVKVEADGLLSQLLKENKKEKNSIQLTFANSLSETTLLRWQFRMLNKQIKDRITVDGLKVQGANRETGVIRMERTISRRLIPVKYDNQIVTPVNVDTLVDSRNLIGAFRVNSQPFALNLDVEQIQPYFSVEPEFRLVMTEKTCELQGHFLVNIIRGSLSNLVVEWPGLDIGIRTPDITSPSKLNITWPVSSQDNQIHIDFDEAQKQQCEIFFRYQLNHSPNQEPYSYTLPRPVAPIQLPARLLMQCARNVEAQIHGLADTELIPLEQVKPVNQFPGMLASPINLQDDIKQYRIKGNVWSLLCNVRTFLQDISTSTQISTRLLPMEIQVEQKISYQIKHEPLHHIHLIIPKNATDLQIKLEQNRLALKNFATVSQAGQEDVTLEFTSPVTGSCDVIAKYRIPLGKQKETEKIVLSIINSKDKAYSKATYVPEVSLEGLLNPDPGDWKLQDEKLSTVYEYQSVIPLMDQLKVSRKKNEHQAVFENAYALMLINKENANLLKGIAIYRFEQLPDTLEFELKDNTWIKGDIYWNQTPVTFSYLEPTPLRRIKIELPQFATEGHFQLILPFECHIGESSWGRYPVTSLINHWTIEVPRLTKGSFLRNSIWEINMSGQEMMFESTSPADSLNNWFWNWTGISLHAGISQRNELLQGSEVKAGTQEMQSQHTYRFITSGPASQLSLLTLDSLFVIFTGLILGLVMVFLCLNSQKKLAGRVLAGGTAVMLAGYLFLPTGMILWGQYFLSGITLGLIAFYFDDIHLKSQRKRPVIIFTNDASSYQSVSNSAMNPEGEQTRIHEPQLGAFTTSSG